MVPRRVSTSSDLKRSRSASLGSNEKSASSEDPVGVAEERDAGRGGWADSFWHVDGIAHGEENGDCGGRERGESCGFGALGADCLHGAKRSKRATGAKLASRDGGWYVASTAEGDCREDGADFSDSMMDADWFGGGGHPCRGASRLPCKPGKTGKFTGWLSSPAPLFAFASLGAAEDLEVVKEAGP